MLPQVVNVPFHVASERLVSAPFQELVCSVVETLTAHFASIPSSLSFETTAMPDLDREGKTTKNWMKQMPGWRPDLLIFLFSSQNTQQKQLTEGKVPWVHGLRVHVGHHGREGMAARGWGRRSYRIYARETETWVLTSSCLTLFLVQNPAPDGFSLIS